MFGTLTFDMEEDHLKRKNGWTTRNREKMMYSTCMLQRLLKSGHLLSLDSFASFFCLSPPRMWSKGLAASLNEVFKQSIPWCFLRGHHFDNNNNNNNSKYMLQNVLKETQVMFCFFHISSKIDYPKLLETAYQIQHAHPNLSRMLGSKGKGCASFTTWSKSCG